VADDGALSHVEGRGARQSWRCATAAGAAASSFCATARAFRAPLAASPARASRGAWGSAS